MAGCAAVGYSRAVSNISRLGPPVEHGDDGNGRTVYRMPLSDEPDDTWIDLFDAGPTFGSLNPPHVQGDEVVFAVAAVKDLPDHVQNVDDRIAYANSQRGKV